MDRWSGSKKKTVDDNGKMILAFLEGDELTAKNGRKKYDMPEYTRQRAVQNGFSISDTILIDREYNARHAQHVCIRHKDSK